jgi:LAO/AO transport system kinase
LTTDADANGEAGPAGPELVEQLRAGDRRALARAITLVESTRDDHRREAEALLDALTPAASSSHGGLVDTIRIGITGSPGVGKSTFIEAFGGHVVEGGHRLAVLAVDPSSRRTGGSILGDKTRMTELSRRPEVFIRPSPGGTQLGGVARRTREAVLLCEAAGYDVVLVETIGVGQSEVAVADMVDLFCLLVGPAGGDDLQGVKRGIMELADLVVVNKADGELEPAALRAQADYVNALHLLRPKWRSWTPTVLACSSVTGVGIDAVWDAVAAFRDTLVASGEADGTRSAQTVAWMWSEIRDTLLGSLRDDPTVRGLVGPLEKDVAAGRVTPSAAARRLLEAFRG